MSVECDILTMISLIYGACIEVMSAPSSEKYANVRL